MASSEQQEIKLSVEETNRLRAELGLAPLRGVVGTNDGEGPRRPSLSGKKKGNEEEVLELSVDETNALREKLGLKPLSLLKKKEVVHKPAENEGEKKAAAERSERAELKERVEQGAKSLFSTQSLGAESTSAKSWAKQMRSAKGGKKKKDTKSSRKKTTQEGKDYDESDLKGLHVAHSVSELQEGSTTVLTLADAPLLKTKDDTSQKVVGLNEEEQVLENVNLADQHRLQRNLKEKRKVELGLGRAGGYAGFDDDEFEELGGAQAPTRMPRGGPGQGGTLNKEKPRGFQIGAMLEEQEKELESDLFAQQEGRAVSLEPSRADVTASDFLTVEEDRKVQRESRKKKEEKDGKFRKKKKSKKDKKKDPRRRRALESDEEEEEKREVPAKGLLQELEETAVQAPVSRKRRRMDGESAPIVTSSADETLPMDIDGDKQVKRQRFDEIMAKGNERSRQAFLGRAKTAKAADLDEDEPDDAFLSAAVEKARRLNRLKEISSKKATGADAVVAAVQRSAATEQPGSSSTAGTVTFSVDETREFTRALLARSEQAERESARKKVASQEPVPAFRGSADNVASEPEVETVAKDEEPEEEVDIHELAKQVKEEDIVGLDSTGSDVPVGRGVGSVLSLLKQTGEMSRKNAGKEEMRGRAKDERTYEDYEPLDLSKVVKIDERRATEKDKELAHREVKLEYRDKHGRLLTRKEAFRELSYQFHGYGSGKRKEEKKLQQIAREQALARQAAAGEGAGTFGALKATQKATGKAFVVHKT